MSGISPLNYNQSRWTNEDKIVKDTVSHTSQEVEGETAIKNEKKTSLPPPFQPASKTSSKKIKSAATQEVDRRTTQQKDIHDTIKESYENYQNNTIRYQEKWKEYEDQKKITEELKQKLPASFNEYLASNSKQLAILTSDEYKQICKDLTSSIDNLENLAKELVKNPEFELMSEELKKATTNVVNYNGKYQTYDEGIALINQFALLLKEYEESRTS